MYRTMDQEPNGHLASGSRQGVGDCFHVASLSTDKNELGAIEHLLLAKNVFLSLGRRGDGVETRVYPDSL